MEQTSLQKRIEERATVQLLKDLKIATDKQDAIIALVGKEIFPEIIQFRERYDDYRSPKTQVEYPNDEKHKKIIADLMPRYIAKATDDILSVVNGIEWLLNNKDQNNDY